MYAEVFPCIAGGVAVAGVQVLLSDSEMVHHLSYRGDMVMGDAVVMPPEAETPALSFPERLLDVFISPGEAFEDVARRPGFWAPLITVILGSVAFVETMLWKIGAERLMRANLELSGRASRMSPEQIDQAVSQGAKFTAIAYHIGGLLGAPIVLLIIAGVGILVVNVIFGARSSFKTVFSLVCYADLVSVLGALMSVALIIFGDPDHFNPQNPVPGNVGFFLNPHEVSKPLYALASSADIFSVWLLILLGLGLSKGTGGKVKPMPIFLALAGVWILYVLAKVGFAMI